MYLVKLTWMQNAFFQVILCAPEADKANRPVVSLWWCRSCSKCPWTSVHAIWKKHHMFFLLFLFFWLKHLLEAVCWSKEHFPCRRKTTTAWVICNNQSLKPKSTHRVDLLPWNHLWWLHSQHLAMCTFLKFTTMATTTDQDQLGI